MAECQFVDRSFTPDPRFNKAINFRDMGGHEDYIFYDHDDGLGQSMRVQFCKLCGRKRNVFECLNESEWKACFYYRVKMRRATKVNSPDALGTLGTPGTLDTPDIPDTLSGEVL